MPDNIYNQNFLESPDPVSGLQRRTGQSFIDHKQTLHERLTLEHELNPDDTSPQPNHGMHSEGSARAYVTQIDDPSFPSDRPTGEDKTGTEITAWPLNVDDTGRLFIKEGKELWYWDGPTLTWVQVDTTPVGMIQIWPGGTISDPPANVWLKCDGLAHPQADFPDLFAAIGHLYSKVSPDPIADFYVPDLQGVSVVGSGTLNYPTDGVPSGVETDRIKGNLDLVGTYREDNLQTIAGKVNFPLDDSSQKNIARAFEGVFVDDRTNLSPGGNRIIDTKGSTSGTWGFRMDGSSLTAAGVRNGEETRSTAMAMDYYIKAK